MACDETLAERVRAALGRRRGVSERKMFGGLAFLVAGNMACGVLGDELMVRVGPEAWEEALGQPHARVMDFTGRPLRGFVTVARPGLRSDAALHAWVDRGTSFARSLPAKAGAAKGAGAAKPTRKAGAAKPARRTRARRSWS